MAQPKSSFPHSPYAGQLAITFFLKPPKKYPRFQECGPPLQTIFPPPHALALLQAHLLYAGDTLDDAKMRCFGFDRLRHKAGHVKPWSEMACHGHVWAVLWFSLVFQWKCFLLVFFVFSMMILVFLWFFRVVTCVRVAVCRTLSNLDGPVI